MPLFARKVNNYDLFANHAWYVPGVGGMFGLLFWFLVGNLLGGLLLIIAMLLVPREIVDNYGMLVVYPLSFLPAMVYVAGKSQRNSLFEPGYKLNSSHFAPSKGGVMALVTVLVTFATMVVADLPNYLNYKLTTSVPALSAAYDRFLELMQQLAGGPFWSSFLVAAIFAPIFEEWMCRGMVLRGLLTKMKPGWAIVWSALFFAVIHMNPWQALNAFIIGLVMGFIYYKTGSLWLTMLMHFVNNATAVIAAQFASPEEAAAQEYWIQMLDKPVYIALYLGALAVFIWAIWMFKRIPLEQQRGNIDQVELQAE